MAGSANWIPNVAEWMSFGRRALLLPTPCCPGAVVDEVTAVRVLVVVEDDEDVQDLIETVFSLDSRFSFAGVSATAEDAFEMARTHEAGLIVLDHGLAGPLTGLEAAPRFKQVAPLSKIILFTAHAELRDAATADSAVDAFVLKIDSTHLLRVAQHLLGMSGSAN